VGISADDFMSSTSNANAFKAAIASSMPGILPGQVNIVAVVLATGLRSRRLSEGASVGAAQPESEMMQQQQHRQLASGVTVTYTVTYILELLGYTTVDQSYSTLSTALYTAVTSGAFQSSLSAATTAYGATALANVVASLTLTLQSPATTNPKSKSPTPAPSIEVTKALSTDAISSEGTTLNVSTIAGIGGFMLCTISGLLYFFRHRLPFTNYKRRDTEALKQLAASADSSSAAAPTRANVRLGGPSTPSTELPPPPPYMTNQLTLDDLLDEDSSSDEEAKFDSDSDSEESSGSSSGTSHARRAAAAAAAASASASAKRMLSHAKLGKTIEGWERETILENKNFPSIVRGPVASSSLALPAVPGPQVTQSFKRSTSTKTEEYEF